MTVPVKKQAVLASLIVFWVAAIAWPAQNPNRFPPVPKKSRRPLISAKILAAKSVYLDNETGYSAVGRDALRELSTWGRFQIVGHDQAQLLMILSTQEYNSDGFGSGGDLAGDNPKLPRKPLNAFLTVIDKSTGDRVWIDSHPWGGLFTGANSAGWRLIARFRKRVEHTHAAG